jgi:hypothetical protein
VMNLQNIQHFKRCFSKQKSSIAGHVCVSALRPCRYLTFKVQILIVLLIFVAMEFLSPYLTERFYIFRRYRGFSLTTFLQATKYSTPMVKHVS